MPVTMTPAHGYVALAVSGSYIVHHMYMNFKVVMARKAYKVSYPDLYATSENCKNEDHRKKFNCVQRGHQNALENQPMFLAMLPVSGTAFPLTAAISAASYLVGRVVYMEAYASGNPDARLRGALPIYAGVLTLLGCCITLGVQLLKGTSPLL